MLALVTATMSLSFAGCSGEEAPVEETRAVVGISPELDQRLVVPTSRLRLRLIGSDRIVADHARVTLRGDIEGGESFEVSLRAEPERQGDVGELFVTIDAAEWLWPKAPAVQEWFAMMRVEVSLRDEVGEVARGELAGARVRFIRALAPQLTSDGEAPSFVNGSLRLEGHGVLRPEEGQTWAVVEQGFVEATPGGRRDLSGERLPVRWSGTREVAEVRLEPGVFGVHPGEYDVTLRLENELREGAGVTTGQSGLEVAGPLQPTFLATLEPASASRGQIVTMRGRGFVGAGQGYGMILRYEGTFDPADAALPSVNYEGSRALERAVDVVQSDEVLLQEVWYSVEGRTLGGLGATPGIFEGSITPVVFDGAGESVGVGWQGEFEVLPTRQVVWLKYLPAFSRALDTFGLGNVEREIRDRILAVARRDFEGVNIVFVEDEPEDFGDYAVVEMGGPDPSGNNAFGYDNTFNDQAKDTGNLYLNDYLGGINRQSGENFNVLFGGVFVESFTYFSPTLTPGNRDGSEHFDRVFGPFMPALGGEAVRGSEVGSGPRAAQIEEAVRVAGNVIGNTMVHEIGHSLGLTHLPEDWEAPGTIFHNAEPGGFIMDAGSDRSFEQRAELDGEGPAVFNEVNSAYLREILPLD
ncbi:hypothetical protein FRC98_20650 [Lujinxingia vulgaris]|uniref:Uncharacterized protein n=1 Tax=Lujinxingia vulgaris TaxID=2600176 RepID=A0A5C6X267_9DELT|nr:hypothetical protein FRC98_20650 [Lujinxingia vulgaris]